MYYESYSNTVTGITSFGFFRDKKKIFGITITTIGSTEISVSGDDFFFKAKWCWDEKLAPGQSVRTILDKNKRPVAAVTYLGGSLNLLQYMGKRYRIMHIGNGWVAFNEHGSMVFCLKYREKGIPEYAREHLFSLEGYSYEMIVDDDLPLSLQALLAASPYLAFRPEGYQ